MAVETITCNSCGAPLQVRATANYVTCAHCHSQLAITRTDTATFTEQIEQLAEQTEQLTDQVERLTAQNDLHALDREWELERETYMVTNKHGRRSLPTQSGSIVGGIVAAGFGIFWIVMASDIGGGIFPAFGVLFILIGIGSSVVAFNKAGDYRRAHRRYRSRRSELSREQLNVPDFD